MNPTGTISRKIAHKQIHVAISNSIPQVPYYHKTSITRDGSKVKDDSPIHDYLHHFLIRSIHWELLTLCLLTESQQHSVQKFLEKVTMKAISNYPCH